ncbi:hypothetical protein ACWD7F_12675 [Streptomyces sp. NPDC005122]
MSTGKNLEVYVTMAVSAVLAVLDVVGTASIPALIASSLATLTLLAGSTLGTRRHIDELTHELRLSGSGQAPARNYLSTDKPDLPAEVATAQEIRIMGVTLSRTLRNLYSLLKERVTAGAHVMVILIDPETTAPLEAARRSTVSDQPTMFREPGTALDRPAARPRGQVGHSRTDRGAAGTIRTGFRPGRPRWRYGVGTPLPGPVLAQFRQRRRSPAPRATPRRALVQPLSGRVRPCLGALPHHRACRRISRLGLGCDGCAPTSPV